MVWGKNPGGTDAFYSRISDPTEVAKNVLYITMTLVADSFVVRSSLSPLLASRHTLNGMPYCHSVVSVVCRMESSVVDPHCPHHPSARNGR